MGMVAGMLVQNALKQLLKFGQVWGVRRFFFCLFSTADIVCVHPSYYLGYNSMINFPRVVYEDGDWEDLNETECRSAIDLCKKIDSGEVNEWEIGGDE